MRALESDAGGSDEAMSSSSPEEEAVPAMGAAESSKVATRHSSLEKGMLRRGFLLR